MLSRKKIITFALVAIAYSSWLFTKHPNLGPDLSYDYLPIVNGFPTPHIWLNSLISNGLGAYTANTLWTYPVQVIFQILLILKIPFWFQMKFLAVLPILAMSYFGLKKLSYIYNFDLDSSFLFYTLNTYILMMIDGGQLNLALAYAIVPLCFYLYKKALKKNFKNKLLFALSVWLLGSFDFRIIYVLAILIGTDTVLNIQKDLLISTLKKYLSIAFIVSFVLITLNLYWILPGLFSKTISLPDGHNSISEVSRLSFTSIAHALGLQQPHWYLNTFGQTSSPVWYFMATPLLAFAILLTKKSKQIRLFWTLAIIGIFLSKGSNPPFPGIYNWLFEYLPGFNLFRDSTKFFIITAFSYSILIGYLVNYLSKKRFKAFFYIYLIYLMLLIHPLLLGKLTGTFSITPYLNEQRTVSDFMQNQNEYYRSLWVPSKTALGYASHKHPSIDTSILSDIRPFYVGNVGKYETTNFLRESPYVSDLLSILGVKYIILPYPDERKKELSEDEIEYYHAFSDQVGNLDWIRQKLFDSPLNVFETKEYKNQFFMADNSFAVIGSDEIYKNFSDDIDLASNALIFLEEKPGLASKASNYNFNLVNNKKDIDLLLSFAEPSLFYFPAKELSIDPNGQNWWKRDTRDFVWWRDFLQQKYNLDNQDFDYKGGWSISEGENEMTFETSNLNKSEILFARVMKSNKSGEIIFKQNNILIGKINTFQEKPKQVEIKLTGYKRIPDHFFTYDKADFEWVEVGNLIENNNLSITTKGDINVVNALVSISRSKLESLNAQVSQTNNEESDFSTNSILEVDYERITPTYYKLSIKGVSKPSTLIFAESYDDHWYIEHSKNNERSYSYPVYSFINGFEVKEDGDYFIFYEPQRLVNYGLIVSTISFGSILTYLLSGHFARKLRK